MTSKTVAFPVKSDIKNEVGEQRQQQSAASLINPAGQGTTWIRSDEGLTLETSASESLYGGQFTLSTS